MPGAVTAAGEGPPPRFVESLDDLRPARDLLRRRRTYFIGVLDPCASIEFARGCPWDCSFCSAWTFYGRSYRTASPEVVAEELARIREPGVFIVDDVAFIQAEHGFAIGEAIARRGIRKQYYLETRGDVLLRNKEVFRFWQQARPEYMFLGLEAIDEEGLKRFRKRVTLGSRTSRRWSSRARSASRSRSTSSPTRPGTATVSRRSGKWCLEIPEIVNLSVTTPYPGTEIWHTEHAPADHARLPAVRHPARGAADDAAAGASSTRSWSRRSRSEPQAPGLHRLARSLWHRVQASDARADEFPSHDVEVQFGVQSGSANGGSRPGGPVRAAASPCCWLDPGQTRPLHPSACRPAQPHAGRGDRGFRGRHTRGRGRVKPAPGHCEGPG